MDSSRIVVIAGPTGVGKSELAVEIAEAVDGEIIGADSVQVYRKLDIGSAKPTREMRQRVHHHLVDFLEPDEPFNAALFKKLADDIIGDVLLRGKVPIVVGGTGLYIHVLLRGIFDSPDIDDRYRTDLEREINARGLEILHSRLAQIDPVLASKIDPHDRTRIIRGLEVYHLTGIPLSEHQKHHAFAGMHYEAYQICLTMDRKVLYERIEQRVDQMIAQGLLEEYESLMQMGYDPTLKPLLSLGYRQIGQAYRKERSLEQAVEHIKRDTKRYAKRQLTWFKRDPNINWIERPTEGTLPTDVIIDEIQKFVTFTQPVVESDEFLTVSNVLKVDGSKEEGQA